MRRLSQKLTACVDCRPLFARAKHNVLPFVAAGRCARLPVQTADAGRRREHTLQPMYAKTLDRCGVSEGLDRGPSRPRALGGADSFLSHEYAHSDIWHGKKVQNGSTLISVFLVRPSVRARHVYMKGRHASDASTIVSCQPVLLYAGVRTITDAARTRSYLKTR